MKPIIIGAGIGGLSTALALKKHGIDAHVFEKAAQLQPAGAGIWMAPNALKVFDWLGIGEKVREAGMPLEKVEICNIGLKPFKTTKSNYVQDSQGNSIISIHRAKLQEILLSGLDSNCIHLGKVFDFYEEKNAAVNVRFKEGSESDGNILLAADGIHSAVRSQLFPESSLYYSGQSCWRGVADISLPEMYRAACIESWGPGIRFGFSVIGPGKVYWFAVIKSAQGEKDNPLGLKDKILEIYKNFGEPVGDIIRKTEEATIIRTDLSDLNRLKNWHKSRVCLLGDAAHATTPNMGQGGAQAVEDAYYISQFLTKYSDPETAFRHFEIFRRKKVDYIVKNSRMFGQMAHSFWGQKLAVLALKMSSEKMLVKKMQKIYNLDPLP